MWSKQIIAAGLFPTIAFGLDKASLDPGTRNEHHLRFYREQIAAMGSYAQKYLIRGHMIPWLHFDNPTANVRFWGYWLKPPRVDLYPHRAVIHSAWQAPDNDVAFFFVNITNKPLEIDIEIPHLTGLKNVRINEYVLDKKKTAAKETRLPVAMELRLEPSGFVMLEVHGL